MEYRAIIQIKVKGDKDYRKLAHHFKVLKYKRFSKIVEIPYNIFNEKLIIRLGFKKVE